MAMRAPLGSLSCTLFSRPLDGGGPGWGWGLKARSEHRALHHPPLCDGEMGNTFSAWRLGLWRKAGARPRLAPGEGSGRIDAAELDGAVTDNPVAGFVFGQTDGLADQCLAEEEEPALPFDLAVVADPADLMTVGVFRLAQPAAVRSGRGLIVLGRRGLAERLMRALLVEHPPEAVEAPRGGPSSGAS